MAKWPRVLFFKASALHFATLAPKMSPRTYLFFNLSCNRAKITFCLKVNNWGITYDLSVRLSARKEDTLVKFRSDIAVYHVKSYS